MTYLSLALLVVAPIARGALAAAVRRWRWAAHGLAALAMAAVLAGVLLTAPATALTIGNTDLDLTAIGRLELGFVAAVGALIVGYHFLSRRHSALPVRADFLRQVRFPAATGSFASEYASAMS